jgi:hypothetical protein
VSQSPQAPAVALSAASLSALRNLARKQVGEPVGWIAIAEAQGLTEIGYARRNQSGWQITASGLEALALLGLAPAPVDGTVLPFHAR